MKIERLTNDQGEFRCFEVENRMVSRVGMAKVISSLEGVNVQHQPRFYDDEVFCKFTLGGHKFEMTEPYGDSSVYDIVAPEADLLEMSEIANHFEISKPIKGGDAGRRLFFITNWVVSTAIYVGVVNLAIWGYSRLTS